MAEPPSPSEKDGTFISGEEAKAVQKLSDFGTTVVTEVGQLARYIGRILGTVPENAVGVVIGDPLQFVRTAIAAQYDALLSRILRDRNVTPQPVSPSLGIPLIRAAYDESRPELQELWAHLIAAAMDPSRANRVRRSFIEAIRQFDPLDALVLKELFSLGGERPELGVNTYLIPRVNANQRELEVSFQNLVSLKCVRERRGWEISDYGFELVRACSD